MGAGQQLDEVESHSQDMACVQVIMDSNELRVIVVCGLHNWLASQTTKSTTTAPLPPTSQVSPTKAAVFPHTSMGLFFTNLHGGFKQCSTESSHDFQHKECNSGQYLKKEVFLADLTKDHFSKQPNRHSNVSQEAEEHEHCAEVMFIHEHRLCTTPACTEQQV